jgi:arylformamidase
MSDWIDVSVPLHDGMAHWPGDQPFERKRDSDMEKGDHDNVSQMTTSVHVGTHMDAPLHFIKNGEAIDRIPLDVCIGRARIIGIANQERITPQDLDRHNIRSGERILFKTTNSDRVWRTNDFQKQFVSIAADAARYLGERKPRLVGVDYLSVGAYHGDGAETHQALLGAGIWIIEGLDLSSVEPGDYDLICLPLKIAGSDGAPARAVLRPA